MAPILAQGMHALSRNFVGTTCHNNVQRLDTLGPTNSINGNGYMYGKNSNAHLDKDCLSPHVAFDPQFGKDGVTTASCGRGVPLAYHLIFMVGGGNDLVEEIVEKIVQMDGVVPAKVLVACDTKCNGNAFDSCIFPSDSTCLSVAKPTKFPHPTIGKAYHMNPLPILAIIPTLIGTPLWKPNLQQKPKSQASNLPW